MYEKRTIKVTGRGFISLVPDTTVINLSFYKTLDTYEEALKASTHDVTTLKELLSNLGLEKSKLKTTEFDINASYKQIKNKDGEYVSTFVGYRYNQTLVFEFNKDNILLGKVLYLLSKSDINPNISISYKVKDEESAKNLLLASAVKDATNKAKVIAYEAMYNLGNVLDIDYSFSRVEFISRRYDFHSKNALNFNSMCDGAFDIDIEPEDIERSDTITMVFELK